jgi:carboxyl-terminal processing protease
MHPLRLLPVSLLLGGFALLRAEAPPAPLRPQAGYDKIAQMVGFLLPQAHMKHYPLDDALARKAMDVFIDTLDPDHSFLLQADVEAMQAQATRMDDWIKAGDLDFAYQTFELYRERIRNRVAYVNRLLDAGLDVTDPETYLWKRKDTPWPADEKAWDDLWRRKLEHEYVSRVVGKKREAIEDAEKKRKEEEKAAREAAGEKPAAPAEEVEPPNPVVEKFKKLSPEDFLRRRYQQLLTVTDGHDAEWVLQVFLDSFSRAYDTHTSYMSPRVNEDFDIQMKLSLQGIGALLSSEDGAAQIIRLIPGGPAARDGRLKVGDQIIAVAQENGEPEDILFLPLYKAVRLIRGPKDTTVTLTVVPKDGGDVRLIDLQRGEIKLEDKAAKGELREVPRADGGQHKLGVITLPDFYADMKGRFAREEEARSCSVDVRRLLVELSGKGAEGFILDLRNNGGGSLPDCVEMSGYFVDQGPIVQVKSEGRVRPLADPEPGVITDKPLIILVNKQSASASEILAAALQDYGRAIIVGDHKTHGKGTVQTLLPVDRGDKDAGSLKVTTAGFFRVNGDSTQLKGVRPDILLPSPYDVMEIGEEFLPNNLPWDSVAPARYQKIQDLGRLLPRLREASEKRVAASEAFRVRQQQIAKLKEQVERTEVSLRLEERLAQAEADEELRELQDSLLEQNEAGLTQEEKDKQKADDLVLNETLLILRDFLGMLGTEI